MSEAFVGLIGVLVGLAIGRGYSFWAGRHGELGKAVVAAAILGEELRALRQPGTASVERMNRAWREYRGSMVIHMSPSDFGRLGQLIEKIVNDATDAAALDEATGTMDALHRLFWEEHEAFILIPLIHYLRGDTMSKRIRAVVDTSRDTGESTHKDRSSSPRRWHTPAP
jgi:hypothetical protein